MLISGYADIQPLLTVIQSVRSGNIYFISLFFFKITIPYIPSIRYTIRLAINASGGYSLSKVKQKGMPQKSIKV